MACFTVKSYSKLSVKSYSKLREAANELVTYITKKINPNFAELPFKSSSGLAISGFTSLMKRSLLAVMKLLLKTILNITVSMSVELFAILST